ncbi:MAG: alanine--tRNA ligase, partial [Minisyncoccia bacterium]
MKTNDVRTLFLKFMEKKGHVIIPSSLLVPENDPTTLFTGSGMQPMVPYLLGQKHPLGTKIADSQKCFRSQDIEEVGDNRHTTFFEMLGNWSLGDFFKQEQIPWMWEFLTEEIKLDPNKLYFSCFRGNDSLGIPKDTESAELWQKLFAEKNIIAKIGENPEVDGIKDAERIFYYPEKKNWWSRSGIPANMPVGEPGGPDTEMFYDFYPDLGRNCIPNTPWSGEFCHVNCDCGRFVEIGNNVFMEYVKTENGFEKLAQQNVDFGGGLERMTAATQNDADVFNMDVFDVAKKTIERLSGKTYTGEAQYAFRVILDHIRAATFLISDGVLPGNKDQSYFVRRLIRRAVRFARNLDIHTNFCAEVSDSFIQVYKDEYKNLEAKRVEILSEITKEEEKFRKTLENGIKEFEKIKTNTISGEDAFNLLQSYGFPVELTEELAKEKGVTVDREEFNKLKDAHAESSRTASAGKFKGGLGGDGEMEVKYHTATHLLHQALREVLGEQVFQKGSNITPERLRFDFSHDTKMTDEEKKKVEDLINSKIAANLPVIREEVSFEEAKARGAIGLFEDKYS